MVEYTLNFNLVFQALSDSTRRDIMTQVLSSEQRIVDLTKRYSMSFSAVAKHIEVLVAAKLISKQKKGREQVISVDAESIKATINLLEGYQTLWNERFDRLETVLKVGI